MSAGPHRCVRSRAGSIAHVALALASLALASHALAANLDHATALTRARDARDRVSSGETSPLWPEFSARMQSVLKDSSNFATMSAGIHAQLGAIDSVLSEEVSDRDSNVVVVLRCRFAKLALPVNVTVAFDPAGWITTLTVRPEVNQEYPSKFLDYATKTRFELPFRGEWWVAWGGRTLGENYHAATRSQRFAHDLLMVKDGKTHAGEGKALSDYYCYGQPILAPAAGTIVAVADTFPDLAVGSRDPAHAAGNHVVIDHGNGEFSLLAHMQPHSVKVKVGQRVKAGDGLGLAGNSGNTSEPHLHVHLMNGPRMEDSDGLPMPFSDYVLDGKVIERGELRRFQLVKRHER
jgi:murein DD-endopeptidase MepM/ murein hydrolase activator NlpD